MRQSTSRKCEKSSAIVLIGACVLFVSCQGQNESAKSQVGVGAGTCADPVVISDLAPLAEQSTTGSTDSMSGEDPTCVSYATHGPDRVYQMTIPATERTKLHVEVTPEQPASKDAFDPVLYVSDSCSAKPTCVVGQDARGGGGKEALDWENSSTQEKTVYIVIDGYGFQPNGGAYTIAVTLLVP